MMGERGRVKGGENDDRWVSDRWISISWMGFWRILEVFIYLA
jgi:hypothetical protein